MLKRKEEFDQIIRNKNKKSSSKLIRGNLIKLSNEPRLNKYLEITMNRFTAKCSFLINQIQEMKSDFVSQLEGINALFSIKQKTISTKTKRQEIPISIFEENINNANERQINVDKKGNQIYLNTEPSSKIVNKEEENDNQISFNNLNKNDSSQNLSIKIIQTNEESMKLKIDFKDKKKINVTKAKIKDNVNNKIKAVMLICNSEYYYYIIVISLLNFEEKAKIKRLNSQLHQEKSLKEVWLNSKTFLEESIKQIEAAKFIDLPSNTCQSSLNFIKKENENDLKDMSNKYNKAFFSLIYILFDERIPNNISYEHLYESILRKNQTQSISI